VHDAKALAGKGVMVNSRQSPQYGNIANAGHPVMEQFVSDCEFLT
jgi:hypothetical protein